jgi:hypothetical protein
MVFMISFEEAPRMLTQGRSDESKTPGNPNKQLAEWMQSSGRQKTVISSLVYDFDAPLLCFISSNSIFVTLFDIALIFKFP